MNARSVMPPDSSVDVFVFAQTNDAAMDWLRQALNELGPIDSVPLDVNAILQNVTLVHPAVVFVDFTGDTPQRAVAIAAALRQSVATLQIIAVGRAAEPGSTLAALRAGVRDFIDLDGLPSEALQVTRLAIEQTGDAPRARGHVVALLGARAGMGVSALAANLAVRLRQRGATQDRQVALLDLGVPVGDSMLYLDVKSGFHFVDAVRNLRRIDRTMIQTALTRHASGLAVLPLPSNVADMREVSYAGAISLIDRLRAHFDDQVIDLGGFGNPEFVTQTVRTVDETWVVCDQSAGAILSAVDLVKSLKEREVDAGTLHLIVGRFDKRLDLSSAAIGQRVGLPVLAELPSCTVEMVSALNAGKLLISTAERSPYGRAIDRLVDRLNPATATRSGSPLERLRGMISTDRRAP